MKTLIALPLILVITGTALAQGMPPAGVKTDQVRQETIRARVTGVATVEPWLRTTLSAEAAGLVERYPLREGQPVEEGKTVVCELKRSTLLIDLAEAEALLARARAESENSVETARATVDELKALKDRADRRLDRAEDLKKKGVVTQAEMEDAEAGALAAGSRLDRAQKNYLLAVSGADPASKGLEAEVRRAEARLDRVKDQIRKASILSPVTGLVVRRFTEVGDWVNPGEPVVEIVTLDPVLVRVGVNERDIGKVRTGEPASVTVAAWPGRSFPGKVAYIVPEADPQTRSFPVLIRVDNPDLHLKSGMFARAEIEHGESQMGMTVPKDAIVRGPMGTVIYTLGPPAEGQQLPSAKLIPVRLGLTAGDRIVVMGEGIKPGMPVITAGNEALMPGQPVIPPMPPGGKPEAEAGSGGGGGEAMKLVASSIRYPVTVLVGVILAVLFGVLALFGIPFQMAPTVDRPVITVTTYWRGASPREVEEEITDKLEEQLNTVEGVSKITSDSKDGESSILLEFDWGTDKDVARLDVSEKIGLVGDLPDEADEPVIKATSSDEDTQIAWIVTRSELPVNEVKIVADDVIAPRLKRTEGVGGLLNFGGQEREVQVVVDLHALAARGIPVSRIRDALLRENRNVKAGGLEEGKTRYVVRTVGQYTTLAEIEETVIDWVDGQPIYIRDVAKAEFGYKDKVFSVFQMGNPTIAFGVSRKTGSNTVEVMNRVRATVDWLNSQYAHKGIQLEIVYDETKYIEQSIGLVAKNLLYGAGLAVAVLLIFLRSVMSTFIVAFTIPISVIVTFIFLQIFDRSLNIISLAGLAFAVGMVVDNAIVVLENIFRHQEMGKTPFQAAYDGTVEVWGAILSSTLTTLAVFIPILFVEQEAGQLFRDIAIALSCSIGMSLIVSITVIPMLASRLLKVKEKRPAEFLAQGGKKIVDGITAIVRVLTGNIVFKAVTSAAIVSAALFSAWKLMPPLDYLPQGNRELVLTLLLTPPGFNIDRMEEIVETVEERYMTQFGDRFENMFAVALPDNPILGTIVKQEYASKEEMRRLSEDLQKAAFGVPGVTFPVTFQVPLFASGGGFAGGDLEVTVRGPDLEAIQGIAQRIQGGSFGIMEEAGFSSPPQSSYEGGLPEMRVYADREKAAALGLTVSDVGYAVGTAVEGTLAGTFREKGREIDLTIKGDKAVRSEPAAVMEAPLITPSGKLVKLGDVARKELTTGPASIQHTDLDRSVTISFRVDPTVPLEQARGVLEEKVVGPARADLPSPDVTIDLIGKARDLDLTWAAVSGSFLLAVIIVYLLMSALFESFASPFVILLSVPMALTGGIVGVALARAVDPTVKMDVITMLGFVILAGVVVNNAILIVHQSLNNIRTGLSRREAVIESVRSRVRPIFMSSTTSIMGMLPLVLSAGAGTELYRGLGAVVVGGLALSTVFTLFLIPAMFSLSLDFRAVMTRMGWKPLEEALRETRAFKVTEE